MEYEEIKVLKQSPKSKVQLVRQKDGEQFFIRKILKGRHPVYAALQNCKHPFLPRLYDVSISESDTTVIEEYIDGRPLGSMELSEKQLLGAMKELCSVLEYLHGKNIIHRDIKPSNIILAEDEHIRLIDFDAARMFKDDLEQDTRRLGTRGYAPPEQYGFAQTDARTDIYALGVTMKQLLGDKAGKFRYRRMIQKCTNLNPDERYRSIGQVKRAFSYGKYNVLYGSIVLLLFIGLWISIPHQPAGYEDVQSESAGLTVLPAPDNPRWDGETGIALWGNVPESGNEEDGVEYHWKLYRSDTASPPDFEKDVCEMESNMRGHVGDAEIYDLNLSPELGGNGFYYFAVCAVGDGVNYADSPYVISDAFAYTGESALPLPEPTGLEWRTMEGETQRHYFAAWSNMDDYDDKDCFDVVVYDKSGNYIMNNMVTKETIMYWGWPDGIRIRGEFLSGKDEAYRFVVKVYSSRPNEYRSTTLPEPIPEECYSPWLYRN